MILPMSDALAERIAAWAYPGEFAVYGFRPDEECLRELTNGTYYATVGAGGEPEGYYCFGPSARIPAAEADVYDDHFLDVGLGREPSLCGGGTGAAFVRAGLDFAEDRFHASAFRLTVAAFNLRAVRAYEKAGFRIIRTVTHRRSGLPFRVMTFESRNDKP